MTRGHLVSLGAAIALGAFGCGDNNTKSCDPGTTMDVDGVCTGIGGAGSCSDGTILVDDHCEIDPNACQDGTVLVGGECKDPGAVTADIEEAAEPNGLGLFEVSNEPAGTIALKPEGEHFVIHGTIIPFQDSDSDGQQDADVDTYLIDVTGPVTLNVSADGLNGLAGGFVSVAAVNADSPLASWTRFGVNPTGDTSARKLYLPAAGTYLIAIADTRTLFLTGAAPGATEGNPDLEYYVTIDLVTVTPTALTATNGVATSTGTVDPGDIKIFTLEMGEGFNSAELNATIDQVQESLVVGNTHTGTNTVKSVADGDPGAGATAAVDVFGIRAGDQQTIVVDSVFDYANTPWDYDLTVDIGEAGALSTSGGDVAQTPVPGLVSVFYYDVAADQRLIGMDVAFDRPVDGVIVDENLALFSQFTFNGSGYAGTFTGYKGLLNHAQPGRYYFFVFDPLDAPEDIVATSTYAGIMPAAITKGTPLTNQAPNAFESTPYTYDPGVATDPWQELTASGSGTGTITTNFYDPATSIGRLDPLVSTCSSCEDSPEPVFTHDYAAAGDTYGRIAINDPAQYLVTVRTATTTGTPTFDLEFAPRAFTDLGTATPGTDITRASEGLDASAPVRRYLVRSEVGSTLTMTVSPGLSLGVTLDQLDADEGVLDSASGALGADVELEAVQAGNGWTAYEVTGNVLDTTYDLTLTTLPPPYSVSAGTTAFSDACMGGTVVDMDDLDEGRSTATIAAPAGFELFGTAVTDLNVFSNGFLSFDTNLACASTGGSCFYSNTDIPNGADPDALIAPYWDDIVLDSVCEKTSGTKLTIQWQGELFFVGTPVVFQAILDGATSTIEFVYGPSHVATGDGATIGLENVNGTRAKKLGFNTADTANNTLFTPN